MAILLSGANIFIKIKLVRLAITPIMIGKRAPFLSSSFPAKAAIKAFITAPGNVIQPARETDP